MDPALNYDVAVVGGGIIGLATAMAVSERHRGLRLVILEKEPEVGSHQTGHNSGVIHSGVYYRPGSLKARLCVEGARWMEAFCDGQGIGYRRVGKVIVACADRELAALDELERRGRANGLAGLRRLSAEELREIEPHVTGLAALHVPEAGIVDFRQVARAMAKTLEELGVVVATGREVLGVERAGRELVLSTQAGELTTSWAINCAGLHSDRVAQRMGDEPQVRIIPFRGEYYRLAPDAAQLVSGLIYPVPDPELPFLGVHLTRTVGGEVEAGPNAVLALAREGYSKSRFHPGEAWDMIGYPGFWRLARRYWRTGLAEIRRSFSKRAFLAALRTLVPEIDGDDLLPGGAGVRAQAVDRLGRLVDDFAIMTGERAVHVLNAPSPGATASLRIGQHVAGLAEEAFGLSERSKR